MQTLKCYMLTCLTSFILKSKPRQSLPFFVITVSCTTIDLFIKLMWDISPSRL